VSRATVNTLAGALVAVGIGGYLWSANVVWVLVACAGAALKINDWINGAKR
jgi:hypothetical protein